ncbi:50S ribosome-binding GTPase (macronuclear) [Tetrahymena thermophila SB210]|uniref:50S ribosome-binding GTPase n=1 Tax=Tetrahymena thermophila (strain SB210) TaxID=312017 RepID=Q23QG8_TETTS|nr:50S ribosome-binding GTPase [Tetrahymena thermophila SB210]EAR98920.1 50S ribosome-binding GTPase [Tetrahymena thermophila SB210]|eukprot:XP_001019165.1 50S ribosome-binding GTPase [Tetrahymena thermophila SB210]
MEGQKNNLQNNSSQFLMQNNQNDLSYELQHSNFQQVGNDAGIQIEGTLNNIKCGLQKINSADNNIILVIGNSGSGKTSLSADLSGLQLVVNKTIFQESYLQYKEEDFQKYGKIGSDLIQSETFIPNKFFNQKKQITIWDTPGFDDSRGEEFQIPISFFINKIVNSAKRIKFILVIDGNQLNRGYGIEKGRDLKDLLFSFFSMIRDFSLDISKFTAIVISKANLKKESDFYVKKLKNFIEVFLNEDLCKFTQDYQIQFKKFLQQISNTMVLLFPNIPDNAQVNSFYDKGPGLKILNAIESDIDFCKSEQIQLPLRMKNIEKINQLFEISQRQMEKTFTSICKKISEELKELNELQLKQTKQIIQHFQSLKDQQDESYIKQIKEQFQNLIIEILLENKCIQEMKDLTNLFELFYFYFTDIYCDLISKIESNNIQRKSFISTRQTCNGVKILQQNLDQVLKLQSLKESQRQSKERLQKNQSAIQNLENVSDDFSHKQQQLDYDNQIAIQAQQEKQQQLMEEEELQQKASQDLRSNQQCLEQINQQQQFLNEKIEEQNNQLAKQNEQLEEMTKQYQEKIQQNQQLEQEIEFLKQKNEMEIEYQRQIHKAKQESQLIPAIIGTVGQLLTTIISPQGKK